MAINAATQHQIRAKMPAKPCGIVDILGLVTYLMRWSRGCSEPRTSRPSTVRSEVVVVMFTAIAQFWAATIADCRGRHSERPAIAESTTTPAATPSTTGSALGPNRSINAPTNGAPATAPTL